jgi:Ca2+/H+ antiporter, TMEM165/GDT1 family
MNNFLVSKVIKTVIFVAAFLLVMGTIVMALWNWLMPSLFNLPPLDLGHAIGLLLLARVLSGGFRLGFLGSKEHWEQKKEMWEKFSNMPPEERQKWKEDLRERCESRRMMGFKNSDEEGKNEI